MNDKNQAIAQHSSAKVHRTLAVNADGSYELANLPDLVPEKLDGF